MGSVDEKYREKEHDATRDGFDVQLIAYKRYMANNGVQPLMMETEQALYLDTFSADARLFFLAFAFVDGDGIANGIARNILSYIGNTLGEGDERKRELQEKIDSLEKQVDSTFFISTEECTRCKKQLAESKRELSLVI
jgi:hypothetical protein